MVVQTTVRTDVKLYPKQRAAIFDPARIANIEASTKSGKTVGCLIWIIEQAVKRGDVNYWWIAPVYPQSRIAYTRFKQACAGYAGGGWTAHDSDLRIVLPNGAQIWFKSAEKPDNLYGEDVYAAVLDEATRMREEAWHAIRSTLTATKGPVRIIGNVKGRKNWAYRLARKAQSGHRDMAYHRLTAYDAIEAGILSAQEIQDAKETLPESVFRELYLAEPSDEGSNPFGLAAIDKCIMPLSNADPTAFGIDLAKSLDWTVIIGLDAQGYACRFERWQSDWGQTKRRIVDIIGDVPTLVDSTGVGDPIVEDLQRERPLAEGFKFSSQSKQQLMEGLAAGIQRTEVGFPDGVIPAELREFEYEHTRMGVRYSAPEGLHDDCVMGLGLAFRKWSELRARGPLSIMRLDQTEEPLTEEEQEERQAERDTELLEGDLGWES